MQLRLLLIGVPFLFAASSWADVSGGYIYRGSGELDYLTVTQTEHKLTGYVQSISRDLNTQPGFTVKKLGFEGEISGASFTLHSGLMLSGLSECSGKFTSQGVKVFFPTNSGQTTTLAFTKSTPEQWNAAVTAFEKQCGRDAFNQVWRVAVQNHFTMLKDAFDKAGRNATRAIEALSQEKDRLSKLEDRMKSASDQLDLAHKRVDWAKGQARKAGEIAKDAEATSNGHKSTRAYMGVLSANLSEEQRKDPSTPRGIVVQSVTVGGPGETADIRPKDVIVQIGDSEISEEIDFQYAMLMQKPGATVKVALVREGQRRSADVKLAEPPSLSDLDASSRATQLSYATTQAEYRVTQAEYGVTQAEYARDQVKDQIDQVRDAIKTSEKELAEAHALTSRIEQEGKVFDPKGTYIKRLMGGALWIGIASREGTILAWPAADASTYYKVQKGQGLSIVPVGEDWCMVLLQNKSIGWTRRANLTIKAA
jgi:cellobiose-specific phosphotransferase system component IIA